MKAMNKRPNREMKRCCRRGSVVEMTEQGKEKRREREG